MPWRSTRDPYLIWVSEVMLQQTRVDTVIAYYERFTKRFPKIQDLAVAPEEAVFKEWQGLGYYRRAKHLHAAAKDVVARYGAELPRTKKELIALKGFGEYTSASVASIAFGEPVACVDGNVRRVVSRMFAADESIDARAQELLEPADPSSFNQAMMELGALICLPKNPRCLACPVANLCRARIENVVDRFPAKKTKAAPREMRAHVFVPRHRDRYFAEPCGPGGRFEGLWRFPTLEYDQNVDAKTVDADLSARYGLEAKAAKPVASFKHLLTHRTFHVEGSLVDLVSRPPVKTQGEWLTATELATKPFSKLQQKILDAALIS